MKVLRIFYSLNLGGVQKHYLKMAEAGLIGVTIGFFSSPCTLKKDFENKKIYTFKIKFNGKYHPFTLINLIKFIRKFETIHASKMENTIPIITLASKIAGKKLILQYHFPYTWVNSRKKLIDRICLISADIAIFVSRYVKEHIIKKLEIYQEKNFAVVYNGYNYTGRKKSRRESDIYKTVMLARFVKFKRIEDFIKAADAVSKFRKDIKFTLVGDGPLKEELKQMALKVDNLEIKKAIKDEKEILKKADIGILTSLKEGLPNSIIEYTANDLLTIATNIPPVKEVVPDNHTFLSFKPRKVGELVNKILKAVENPKIKRKITNNAAKRAEKFSIKKTLEKMVEIYAI